MSEKSVKYHTKRNSSANIENVNKVDESQMFEYKKEESILLITLPEGMTNKEILELAKVSAPDISGNIVLKVTGRITVPLAFWLAHRYAHLVAAIAVFDPKVGKYLVVVAHGNVKELEWID